VTRGHIAPRLGSAFLIHG